MINVHVFDIDMELGTIKFLYCSLQDTIFIEIKITESIKELINSGVLQKNKNYSIKKEVLYGFIC